jgi:hypothetical protein
VSSQQLKRGVGVQPAHLGSTQQRRPRLTANRQAYLLSDATGSTECAAQVFEHGEDPADGSAPL